MKIFVFIFILVLEMQSWAGDRLVSAMVALKAGRSQDAFNLLEGEFDGLTPGADRGEVAMLLTTAESSQLKKPLYIYARVALAEKTALGENQRQRLLRILGDDLFGRGDLERAREAYTRALVRGGNYVDREYATYKLGWTELNLGAPERAFELWKNWLTKEQNEVSGSLRRLIIKDSARVWIEAVFAGRKRLEDLDLLVKVEEIPSLIEGVMLAVRREKTPSLDKLLIRLKNSPFYDDVVAHFIEDGGVFSAEPCQVLGYAASMHRKLDSVAQIGERIEACAKVALPKDKYILAQVYGQLQVSGLSRWPKARALKQANQMNSACIEYGRLVTDALDLPTAKVLVPSLVTEMVDSCAGPYAQTDTARLLFYSERVAAQTIDPVWLGMLVLLLRTEHYDEASYETLVSARETWANTPVPSAAFEVAHAHSDRLEKLVEAFAGSPLSNEWTGNALFLAKTYLEHQKNDAAYALLNRYSPITQSGLTAVRLWAALQFSVPELAETQVIQARYLELLEQQKEVPLEDSRAVAFMLMNTNDVTTVWRRYRVIAPALTQHPALLRDLVQKSVVDLPETLSSVKQYAPNEIARYLEYVSALLVGAAGDETVSLPKVLLQTTFAKDVSLLGAARAIEHNYAGLEFKLTPKLDRILTKYVNQLKLQIQQARRHRWSDERFLRKTDQALANAAERLSNAILKIEVPDGQSRQELAALSSLIRTWHVVGDQS
jgi:predicted negative regulator of RcsB-dependent stress response